jgi:hypothetical protein
MISQSYRSLIVLTVLAFAATATAETQSPASQPASQPQTKAKAKATTAKTEVAKTKRPAESTHSAAKLPPNSPVGQRAEEEGPEHRDLQTRLELIRRGSFSLHMGGMIQVQSAFYAGDQAAVTNGDPADTEGFRIRRARFGFGGDLLPHFSYYLAVDLKDTVVSAMGGDTGSELLDATIGWHRFSFAQLTVGVDKVPFSTLAMESSARLTMVERPLTVGLIAPDRRVGATIFGDVGALNYWVGVYNGSDGLTSGNRMAGISLAARVQMHLLGTPTRFVPREFRIAVAGGYMYENGSAVDTHRASGSLELRGFRVKLMGEFLWEQSEPDAEPVGLADSGKVSRWSAVGQASAFLWRSYVQVAFRYEYFRDNVDLPTFGEQQLLTAGVNAYLCKNRLKLQVNYIRRDELEGPEVANDIAFAQLQATF